MRPTETETCIKKHEGESSKQIYVRKKDENERPVHATKAKRGQKGEELKVFNYHIAQTADIIITIMQQRRTKKHILFQIKR